METAKFLSVHMTNNHLEKSNPFVDIKLDTVISSVCISIYFAANRFNLPTAEFEMELPVFPPFYAMF